MVLEITFPIGYPSVRVTMKHLLFLVAIVLLLNFTGARVSRAGNEVLLRAGAAAVDISPQALPALQNGDFLPRVTNRVVDPLHARALLLTDGKETIALVIVDSCMFPTTLCDEIKRLATKETGIPVHRILISATHAHSAPAVST